MIYDSDQTVPSSVKPPEPELSIGTLSHATGVPVDTLRTWERRYGFPTPIPRTEGSHRRYSAETITIVQLIVRALERGHRPSAVVGRDAKHLKRLIETGEQNLAPDAKDTLRVQAWLRLTRELDGQALSAEFHRCLADMPAIDFLERCMGPYLVELGARWQHQELHIHAEHLASERAREFLSAQWRRSSEGGRSPGRPSVVLATPAGERHVLGLHMAAWVVARAGAQVAFLGEDTPMAEVALAVRHCAAQGVVLSVASGYSGDLSRQVLELASHVSPRVGIVVGGAGSQNQDIAARRLNGFDELLSWTARLQSGP
jgi:DNA-binding transcriptional MerR regulator/methylmalonyl-CoA mutase cobalamin-binding subunit